MEDSIPIAEKWKKAWISGMARFITDNPILQKIIEERASKREDLKESSEYWVYRLAEHFSQLPKKYWGEESGKVDMKLFKALAEK
ncbi:MAG: hypothetical protein ACP5F8_02495 [Candidatus Aenigmatarchaeota archaeon]